MQKRGSLKISIWTLGLIIPGIILLGLLIPLLRGQFGCLCSEFKAVDTEITNKLTDQIKVSGQPVVMSTVNIEATRDKLVKAYYAVQNPTNANICQYTVVRCLHAQNPIRQGECDAGIANGQVVGGMDWPGMTRWASLLTPMQILPQSVRAFPLEVRVSNQTRPDTYVMELDVAYANNSSDCIMVKAFTPEGNLNEDWTILDKHQFFLIVR
jgi:hypothetical protein